MTELGDELKCEVGSKNIFHYACLDVAMKPGGKEKYEEICKKL